MLRNYINKIIISKIRKLIKINKSLAISKNNNSLDFPILKINIINSPIPDGIIRAQYNVGLSTVTIVDDQYIINDPFISEEEKEQLERISSQLLFSIPTSALKDESLFRKYIEKLGVNNEVLYYFLRREILGYGVYDVLIQDDNIEDITAWPDGTTCNHKLFGSLKVNISMSESEFNKYIERLVYLSGKSISLHNPIISIKLPTNDRLTVTYSREVSDKPSFSIRKFPKQPWSITSIMMMKTISPEMAAWLMLLVKYKKAILVCGPVGSGKTSLINALCSLIPADQIVVTCEDTPELKLARQNWISLITRESSTVEEEGEIRMFDLVKHALRYPASYIIVGEIRGEEGRVWAQAIATGHGGITSLHAETPEGAIERLKSDPINVAEGSLKELSTIVIMKSLYIKNMGEKIKVKRVMGIYDINPSIKPICLFKYNLESDSFIKVRDPFESNTASKIMEFIPREKLIEEYKLYTRFLQLLYLLGYKKPELTLHTKVTELVWKLYEYEDIPEELLIPEVQLIE